MVTAAMRSDPINTPVKRDPPHSACGIGQGLQCSLRTALMARAMGTVWDLTLPSGILRASTLPSGRMSTPLVKKNPIVIGLAYIMDLGVTLTVVEEKPSALPQEVEEVLVDGGVAVDAVGDQIVGQLARLASAQPLYIILLVVLLLFPHWITCTHEWLRNALKAFCLSTW